MPLLSPSRDCPPDGSGRTKLRWDTLARLPALGTHFNSESALEVRLDECDIIGHDGLIWLLALASIRTPARPTYVYLPRNEAHLRYLNELRFTRLLVATGAIVANEDVLWPIQSRSRLASSVSPFSLQFIQVVTAENCHSLLNELSSYFDHEVATLFGQQPGSSTMSKDSFALQGAIRELILNVPYHAGDVGTLGAGYACYAKWPATYPMIRFCCCDLGHGFRQTLSRKHGIKVNGEAEAIHRALLLRHERPEDGVFGLYRALPFVHSMRGRIFIRSRDTLVELDLSTPMARKVFAEGFAKPDISWMRRMTRVTRLPDIPGCHIALDLSVPRHILTRDGSKRSGGRR